MVDVEKEGDLVVDQMMMKNIMDNCQWHHSIKVPFQLLVEPHSDYLQRPLDEATVQTLVERVLVSPDVPLRPPFVNAVKRL